MEMRCSRFFFSFLNILHLETLFKTPSLCKISANWLVVEVLFFAQMHSTFSTLKDTALIQVQSTGRSEVTVSGLVSVSMALCSSTYLPSVPVVRRREFPSSRPSYLLLLQDGLAW
jgi:hypothetical protein